MTRKIFQEWIPQLPLNNRFKKKFRGIYPCMVHTIPRRRVPNPTHPQLGGGITQYAAKLPWITQKFWAETAKNGLENSEFEAKTQFFSPAAPIATAGGSIIINLVYFLVFFLF